MIDLHTHTLLSDGVLPPAELINSAVAAGYRGVAISDHADDSNVEFLISSLRRLADATGSVLPIRFAVAVEITHVPVQRIAPLVERARDAGADLVLIHGETIVEPVPKGTNRAAVEAGADILAHPGLIPPDVAKMAADRGVLLEISARKGHCLTNGHVVNVGRDCGAKFIIGSDAHGPEDLLTIDFAERLALGAGLSAQEFRAALENAEQLLKRERGR